ncbi:MAG: Uma2 family endonuclease [Janthinobacterium lividum]
MGQAEPQPTLYTAEEYFALEEQSQVRHEFFEGEIFAMAGESVAHNILAQNFVLALRTSLRGKKCKVLIEGIQLAVEQNQHYTYPDVMVSCDPADQRASRTLHHPVLLVEVLLPSTQAYDRGLKFNQYKKLPSLRHYLLVSQKEWLVEWYQLKDGGIWSHTALTEPANAVVIPDLSLNLTLTQIYEEADVAPMRLGFGAEE